MPGTSADQVATLDRCLQMVPVLSPVPIVFPVSPVSLVPYVVLWCLHGTQRLWG